MAKQRTTFAKLQRERAKKAKAAAKRERRQQRGQEDQDETTGLDTEGATELTAPQLLEKIEELHRRFEANLVEFDDFEEQRADLFEKLADLPMD